LLAETASVPGCHNGFSNDMVISPWFCRANDMMWTRENGDSLHGSEINQLSNRVLNLLGKCDKHIPVWVEANDD
jgi:hypothetical protein